MANQKLKFEDFEAEKLSKNQQKTVRGGDDEPIPTDGTGRGGKGGNG
jgi:hypothetical protein